MHYSLFLLPLLSLVSAHGYLSSPPPRGSEKISYKVDDLKSPNTRGICRGEPEGKVTTVTPGQTLRLGLTITAPHVGPCRVTILNKDLGDEQPVAEKMNCAAPGGPGFWDVKLPTGLSGHYVLRWSWEGRHVSPSEPYEQCVDLQFSGAAGGRDRGDDDDDRSNSRDQESNKRRPDVARAQRITDQSSGPSHQAKPLAPSYDNGKQNGNANKNKNKPIPSKPSRYNAAPSAGSCTGNSYRCANDGGFFQCSNGSWVKMSCPTGTQCKKQGQSQIVCGFANGLSGH